MELKLYKEIIKEINDRYYEEFSYYINNPTEDFKKDILEDKFLDFDFSDYEELIGVKLRYYQKLAIYFSNYYFRNISRLSEINPFKNQLAYWMATGSGKTIIMKADIISYINFLKENSKLNSNSQLEIIITSSLTELVIQLDEEFKDFINKIINEFNIDIKLVIETIQSLNNKKEYRNGDLFKNQFRLVLADEAHIGLSSKESGAYASLKNTLVKNKIQSFLFEYSATFDNVKDEEFYKKIVFEYSYGKFFNDFYGKDFKFGVIKADKINEDEEISENIKQNLDDFNKKLESFYEYEKFKDRPLLAVVGNSVKVKKDKDAEQEISDVLKFINYLIKLKDIKAYEKIFNANKKTNLYLMYNKYDDELLLAFDREKPFGLINVGDTTTLINYLNQIENVKYEELNFVRDNWKFKNIDENSSPINILIGSRKFSAGWNSFRVSQICLINFGVGKGSTIIQIFGRGVRLRGFNNDGKRLTNYVDEETFKTEFKKNSDTLPQSDFDKLKYLETLFIYSLKSTYLQKFIEESTDIFKQKIIKFKEISERNKIKSIVIKNTYDFSHVKNIELKDGKIRFEYNNEIYNFNINLKLNLFIKNEKEIEIEDYLWDFIDKNEIKKFLANKKFYIEFEYLKELIKNKKIHILYDGNLTIKSFENLLYKVINILEKYIEKQIEKTQKSYDFKEIDYPYKKYKIEITLKKRNININLYKKIAYEIINEIKEKLPHNCKLPEINILNIFSKTKVLEKTFNIDDFFENIDISIVNPIASPYKVIEKNIQNKVSLDCWKLSMRDLEQYVDIDIEKIFISPDFLDCWELKFLKDLKKYVDKNNLQVKVLRNIPKKGSGIIGEDNDFYPDFIIKYEKNNFTHIMFCDPKGIRESSNFFKVCKVHDELKKINEEIRKQNKNIKFHSFIITHTDFKDIKWEPIRSLGVDKSYKNYNLIFFSDKNYIGKIFNKLTY